jgi:type VI secretion system protein ImpK
MRLTDCFIDLIAYTAYFIKSVNTKQPSFEQVKTDIEHLITESQKRLNIGGFSSEDYDLARFAIFAWIDECILSSFWKERNRWLSERLQRIYYHTFDASEIFFEKLNTLGLHQKEVREVYYLCLAMGFKGRYCNQKDELLLRQLKAFNLAALTENSTTLRSLDSGELFPGAYSVDEKITPNRSRPKRISFVLFCVAFPPFLCVVLFILYRYILSNVGENLTRMIP